MWEREAPRSPKSVSCTTAPCMTFNQSNLVKHMAESLIKYMKTVREWDLFIDSLQLLTPSLSHNPGVYHNCRTETIQIKGGGPQLK